MGVESNAFFFSCNYVLLTIWANLRTYGFVWVQIGGGPGKSVCVCVGGGAWDV